MAPPKKKTPGRGKRPRNFVKVAKETLFKDYKCEIAEECENRISRTVKRDLLGFADMIGLSPKGWVLLQFTSKSNFSSRKNKILSCKNAKYVVKYKLARLLVVGFEQANYGGNYRSHEFTPEDFDGLS